MSDYVVNELIGTIIMTNFTNILPLDTLFDGMDFHITTDMLEPIIPQLKELFGTRDLTFLFKLLDGTRHHWDESLQANNLQVKGQVRVLIDPIDFHEEHEA